MTSPAIMEFLRGAHDLQMHDQIALVRVRDRLNTEPHVQPGSLSYLALAWQYMIDELGEWQ